MDWISVVVGLGVLGAVLAVVRRELAKEEAKIKALVKERTGTYKAVIQDINHMKGWYGHINLFLRIETPEGPIGEYLVVPINASCTMEFLQDARATQRPILVQCCVDRSIDRAYRATATVLGLA